MEVETTKRNREKCKIPTLIPKAALMADIVATVDKEEVEAVIDGTDNQSRV